MRNYSQIFMLICALLLAVLSGFDPIAILCIAVSLTVIFIGEWIGRRAVGIAGFLALAISTAEIVAFPDLTVLSNIFVAGFLFVLPLSFSLWFALTIGSPLNKGISMRLTPYVWPSLFAIAVLLSVPIAGIALHSTRYTSDIGIESQIMLLMFITAILSVAMLGIDEKR